MRQIVPSDNQLTLLPVLPLNVEAGPIRYNFNDDRSPTAGPSGTFRYRQTQDSVIPPSRDGSYHVQADHNASDTNCSIAQQTPNAGTLLSTSDLEDWQVRKLRMELFELLLSFLHGINQFSTEAYDELAEERMMQLLHGFWVIDIDNIRLEYSEDFVDVENAWTRWKSMHNLVADFRRSTGYHGEPGDEWIEYLRGMKGVDHANSSIALIRMQRVGIEGGFEKDLGSKFDGRLAIIFNSLTQIKHCTGVEEFHAIKQYNKKLLRWFL